jgi:hypothetical protein
MERALPARARAAALRIGHGAFDPGRPSALRVYHRRRLGPDSRLPAPGAAGTQTVLRILKLVSESMARKAKPVACGPSLTRTWGWGGGGGRATEWRLPSAVWDNLVRSPALDTLAADVRVGKLPRRPRDSEDGPSSWPAPRVRS